MLLCRTWPLRCKSDKTWAVPYVRDFAHVSRCPPLLQKFPMPCHAQAGIVLWISPEAAPLTGNFSRPCEERSNLHAIQIN